MTHCSRPERFILDCRADDPDRVTASWTAALGDRRAGRSVVRARDGAQALQPAKQEPAGEGAAAIPTEGRPVAAD